MGNALPLFVVFLVLAIQSCTHFRWRGQQATMKLHEGSKKIAIAIDGGSNHFKISNSSDEQVFVSFANSVIEVNGASYRAINGNTQRLAKNMSSPDVPIAPGSYTNLGFYTEDEEINALILLMGAKFTIAVRGEKSKKTSKFVLNTKVKATDSGEILTEIPTIDRYICYATFVYFGGYCWFLTPGVEDYLKASETASEQFGGDWEVHYVDRSLEL